MTPKKILILAGLTLAGVWLYRQSKAAPASTAGAQPPTTVWGFPNQPTNKAGSDNNPVAPVVTGKTPDYTTGEGINGMW